MRAIVIAILTVLIGACSPSKFPESLLTNDERALVRGAVDDVSRGDTARLSSKVQPAIAAQIAEAMPEMQRALPGPPLELEALNTNVSVTGNGRVAEAVYQAKGRSGWALIEANIQTTQGQPRLAGLFVQRVQARAKASE